MANTIFTTRLRCLSSVQRTKLVGLNYNAAKPYSPRFQGTLQTRMYQNAPCQSHKSLPLSLIDQENFGSPFPWEKKFYFRCNLQPAMGQDDWDSLKNRVRLKIMEAKNKKKMIKEHENLQETSLLRGDKKGQPSI